MTTKTRLLAASIAALALLTTVGCGGGGNDDNEAVAADRPETTSATEAAPEETDDSEETADTGDTSGDPCRLLTSTEAEAALGRAVRTPVSREIESPQTGNGFDCAYSALVEDAGPASVHAALLGDKVPRDGWEQAEREQADLVEVEGVGELAFFDEYSSAIDVFDHGRWVQVQMINSTRFSELLALLTDMARNAIERI